MKTKLVGRVSPPTVSRIETANDLDTTVTHVPKEHLAIKVALWVMRCYAGNRLYYLPLKT